MPSSADTKKILSKIESLTKDRMLEGKVVSFQDFRSLRKRQTPRLLIVEDDASIRTALRRIFEGENYRVVVAEDARELTEVVGEFIFDLILLDVGLPWVDGYELAGLLKEHPDLKNIPLIFVSGQTSQEAIKKGFVAGADDFITKPFDVAAIKKTVHTLLELNR